MNAALPVLPVATDSTGGSSGLDTEIPVLQGDSTSQAGFAPVLEQAQVAITGESAIASLSATDAEGLLRQIQSLPQAGKLLPLLEQLMAQAGATGFEPRQLVQRIDEKLQQLLGSKNELNSELNPVETLVSAVQQLLNQLPVLKTPAVADALLPVSGEGKSSDVRPVVDGASGRTQARLMPAYSAVVAGTVEKSPANNVVLSDLDANGLDRALEQAQVPRPESRQVELASVMATLKRLTLQGKSTLTEPPLRVESTAAVVTSQAAPVSNPASSALPTLNLNTPLAQGDWDQALGERIQWMVNQKMQGAQIRLNPAQLGPMEVRIQVQNDQASIQFSSAHGVVREALEAALPRLRELFDASGVELVDVDVSGQSFAGGQRPGGEDSAMAAEMRGIEGAGETETVLETPVGALLANGRLDLFA